MRRLRSWFSRFGGMFDNARHERALSAELESHLQLHIEDNLRAGMSPEEARRHALVKLGGVEQTKENYRDRRGLPLLETLLQDLRFGARMLRKNPGFTAVAVITLALGIGANTAIFSLMDSVLVRELSVRNPSQLVEVTPADRNGEKVQMSFPMYEELQRRQQVFSGTFAYWGDAVLNVEANGLLSRSDIWAVDGSFFSELGVPPLLGRFIVPSDVNLHRGAPAQVAVIGYGFWQRQFGGDPSAIGKTLRVEGVPLVVIGVTPENFTGLSADDPPEVVLPLSAEPLIFDHDLAHLYDRKALMLDVTGRLKDGVTLQKAEAQLSSLWPAIQAATIPADLNADQRQEFLSYHLKVESAATGFSILRGRFSKPLYVLMGISGLVLLIACVNLATLLLSRAAARSHEMSVRVSLGATRWRLARQLLTESILLSVAGAILGFVLANWSSHALADFILTQVYIVPARLNLAPDLRVLAFTAAITLLTGILFGLAPARNATRQGPAPALQKSARVLGSTGRTGNWLICTQVALSLTLLMIAALFVRSFEKLRSNNPGFRTNDVLLAGIFPKPGGYKNLDNSTYYRELTDRIANLPGVQSASISHSVPAMNLEGRVSVVTAPAGPGVKGFDADLQMVAPRLFETLGITLVAGRDFAWSDGEQAPRVAILSQNLAQQLFPSCSALEQHISLGAEAERQNLRVVGVVSNASYWSVRKQNSREIYIPALQGYIQWGELLVRTNGDPRAVASGVRQAVDSLGHEYVTSTKPLSAHVNRSLMPERVTAMFSGFFGCVALLLASIGLYGLMSYAVTRRTQEIGIRVALGARHRSVLWMILRETLGLLFAGLAIGIPCALIATPLIASQLFGLSPRDPATLAFVAFALLVTGALAGYLPARRATRVDPLVALRYE